MEVADIVADGRLHLAAKVHDYGAGLWRYEYAIHNLNSHRSVQRVEIAVPPGSALSNAGFHDVDYHSGEPYSNADWTIDADGPNGHVAWFGETQAANADANALRWGTTYNFWFDSDQAPGPGLVALTLFRAPAAGRADRVLGQPAGARRHGPLPRRLRERHRVGLGPEDPVAGRRFAARTRAGFSPPSPSQAAASVRASSRPAARAATSAP